MSARKRLCFLYRSSFNGSCQYCACTRLITTNTTSSQTYTSVKQDKQTIVLYSSQNQGRETDEQLTVSASGRCTLRCSELYGSCHRCGSSLRDTWAARTLLRREETHGAIMMTHVHIILQCLQRLRQDSFKYAHRNDIFNTYDSVTLSKFHLLRKIVII